MHQTKPTTHTLWLQKWEGGRFREWLPIGKGRVDIDENGVAQAHNFQDLTTVGGWNGYTCLMPNGVKPKDPEVKPSRPTNGDLTSTD